MQQMKARMWRRFVRTNQPALGELQAIQSNSVGRGYAAVETHRQIGLNRGGRSATKEDARSFVARIAGLFATRAILRMFALVFMLATRRNFNGLRCMSMMCATAGERVRQHDGCQQN